VLDSPSDYRPATSQKSREKVVEINWNIYRDCGEFDSRYDSGRKSARFEIFELCCESAAAKGMHEIPHIRHKFKWVGF